MYINLTSVRGCDSSHTLKLCSAKYLIDVHAQYTSIGVCTYVSEIAAYNYIACVHFTGEILGGHGHGMILSQ